MEKTKIGFFRELIKAIDNLNSYKLFMKNKTSKVLKFIFLLGFILFLCASLIPLVSLGFKVGGMKGLINQLPYFELNNSGLYLEEPFLLENYTIYINVDTSNNFSFDDANEYYDTWLKDTWLIDSEKILMKTDTLTEVFLFSSLGENVNLEKEDLVNFIPYVHIFAFLILLIIYIFQVIGLLIGMFVLSIYALILNAFIRTKISYRELFIICVYSRALPILMKSILSILDLKALLLLFFNFAISCIYIILVLESIKSPKNKENIVDYPEVLH